MTNIAHITNPSPAGLARLAAAYANPDEAVDRLALALDGAIAGADAAHEEFNAAEKEAIAAGGIDNTTPRLEAALAAQGTAVAIFDSILEAIGALPGDTLPALRLKAKAAVHAGGTPEGDSLSRAIIAELATQRAA